MAILSKEIIDFVFKEAFEINFGKIIIDIRENGKVIDIVVETRERFKNEKK